MAALRPTLGQAKRIARARAIARATGLSTEALSAEVEQLRKHGLAVEQVGGAGYRLTEPFSDLLVPEAVLIQLMDLTDLALPLSVGLPYRYCASCGSTNLELKREAGGLPSGTVVATDEQTQGRGRLGRSWTSGPGQDLTFSVLLRPSVAPAEAQILSLAVAVAVAEVLDGLPGLQGRALVKWPNDVLIDGKKVCGILLESSSDGEGLEWVVAGIGLNVNGDPGSCLGSPGNANEDAGRGRPRPTSLRAELGENVDRGRLLAELLVRLARRVPHLEVPDVLDRMRARDALLGRELRVFAGPPDGALIVAGQGAGLGPEGRATRQGPRGPGSPHICRRSDPQR